MAGMGKRFLRAGYPTPKPLIRIEGMPIVEHIVRNFPQEDQFVFGVNHFHQEETDIKKILNELVPDKIIHSMPYQIDGPIGTVRELFRYVEDQEPVIVNYCDFSWVWDYSDFKKAVYDPSCDGAVVCYRGFHPHLLGPNLYATLRVKNGWMEEIREKHSWHESKMQDWTSSGTYFFKKGKLIKKYFMEIEKKPELKINGEFYVSQIFQLMKEDGLNILVYEIPFMLQWGTPEDLEEYQFWSNLFQKKSEMRSNEVSNKMDVLILMAGAGNRFALEHYPVPKPCIPVDQKPMAISAALSLPRGERVFFVTREDLQSDEFEKEVVHHFPEARFISLSYQTEGQACTAMAAESSITANRPLLIGACDHGMIFSKEKFAQMTAADSQVDAMIFTIRQYPMARRKPHAYGWVETGEKSTRTVHVSVKVPLPGDPYQHHVVLGAFWFREAGMFFSHARQMIKENKRVNGEFYIDECMNDLIKAGLRVHVFEVESYAPWGTPDELKTYEYWSDFFNQASFHPYRKN